MPAINVLHLRDTDRVCGPGKTIIETACATNRAEFRQMVGLFMLDRETNNRYYDAAISRGVEVIPLRSAHPYDPRIVPTLLRIVREHDIHILHSHEYKSDLLAYLVTRIHPIPVMTTVHGWIEHNVKRRVFVGLSQRVLRRFDRVVAVSEETRRRILRCGVRAERIETIHNGVVVENYDPERQSAGYLRSAFGLPPDAVIVGNVGRLSPEKGQFDFIEAAARVAAACPQLYFVLVGDGPDRAGLEARAAALGLGSRVFFTGFLTDVRPAYRDLDILALTSHTEGFPNVVLEALCMGVPVLATSVGGTGEIVTDGKTGLLVPPRTPDAIATALLRFERDAGLRRALAAAGRAEVLESFSFTARVRSEEDVYRQLIDESIHRTKKNTRRVSTSSYSMRDSGL